MKNIALTMLCIALLSSHAYAITYVPDKIYVNPQLKVLGQTVINKSEEYNPPTVPRYDHGLMITSSSDQRIALNAASGVSSFMASVGVGDELQLGPMRGEASMRLDLNDDYAMLIDVTDAVQNKTSTPRGAVTETGDASTRYIAADGERVNSNLLVRCGYPSYLTYPGDVARITVSYRMYLDAYSPISGTGGVSAIAQCRITYVPTYNMNLSLKQEHMKIVETSGTTKTYTNELILTGDRGYVLVDIQNPNPNDVVVSFSSTDDDSTSVTLSLYNTDTNARQFYVKPKNTSPGERMYTVTFSASYT